MGISETLGGSYALGIVAFDASSAQKVSLALQLYGEVELQRARSFGVPNSNGSMVQYAASFRIVWAAETVYVPASQCRGRLELLVTNALGEVV